MHDKHGKQAQHMENMQIHTKQTQKHALYACQKCQTCFSIFSVQQEIWKKHKKAHGNRMQKKKPNPCWILNTLKSVS